MSSCQYHYQFYFSTPESRLAISDLVPDGTSNEKMLELLNLTELLDDDREYLEHYAMNQDCLELSFDNSTSSSLNDALIRKFKDHGSEFCVVDMFNDQVGEGCKVHIYRGKSVNGTKLEALLEQYSVTPDASEIFDDNDTRKLESALQAGLDVNKQIDDMPLLAHAFENENKPAFDMLLEHGAAIDAMVYDDQPLILYMANYTDHDHQGFLAALIERGANYNIVAEYGGSFLWHLGNADPELRNTLIEKNALFQRPEDAYTDNDEPTDNLLTAASHCDEEMIAKYHAELIVHSDNHAEMADIYCQANRPNELTNLLEKANPNDEALSDLIMTTAEHGSHTVAGILLKTADIRSIDLGDTANEIVDALASHNTCFAELTTVVEKHPESVGSYAMSAAISSNANANLKFLLASANSDLVKPLLVEHLYELSPQQAKLLIEHGADPLHSEYEDENPLTDALGNSDEEESLHSGVRTVLLEWLDAQPPELAATHYLAIKDQKAATAHLDRLPQQGTDPDTLQDLYTKALESGALDAVRKLESLGAQTVAPSDDETPAIVLAVASNNLDTCRHLLQQGADVNTIVPEEYLNNDKKEDDEQLGRLLGVLGVSEDLMDDELDKLIFTETETPAEGAACLTLAAINGNTDMVNLLIGSGATVSHTDNNKMPALMYAAANGYSDVVSALLAAGAEAAAVESRGNTALHYAAYTGSADCCKLLLNANCEVDTSNNTNFNTPLSISCIGENYCKNTINTLIDNGADINQKDLAGHTPLMLSTLYQNRQLTAHLLASGADINRVSGEGLTAYDLFKISGREAIGFNENNLIPTASNIKTKILLAKAKRLAIQIAMVLLVALPIAYFSSLTGAIVGLLGISFFVYREIKTHQEYNHMMKNGAQISDNPIMTNFMSAMTRAQDMAAEQEARNRDIIDSWDDQDDRAA